MTAVIWVGVILVIISFVTVMTLIIKSELEYRKTFEKMKEEHRRRER